MKEVKQLEIKAWIRARREWLAKQAERRSKELMQEANDLLQVREFDGRLFVCYDDIPIIDTCLLKEDLTVAVEAPARPTLTTVKARDNGTGSNQFCTFLRHSQKEL